MIFNKLCENECNSFNRGARLLAVIFVVSLAVISFSFANVGPSLSSVNSGESNGDSEKMHASPQVIVPLLVPPTSITAGTTPAGLVFDPSNGYIYLSDFGAPSVSVIDPATIHSAITICAYFYS